LSAIALQFDHLRCAREIRQHCARHFDNHAASTHWKVPPAAAAAAIRQPKEFAAAVPLLVETAAFGPCIHSNISSTVRSAGNARQPNAVDRDEQWGGTVPYARRARSSS